MSRFNRLISGKTDENGLMQVEVFPQRLLNLETAQKLMDELNRIDGITRMVVHGPRLPAENPDDLLDGRFGTIRKNYLNIKGEMIELHVQIGRIWIEISDIEVVGRIREAGEKILPFPFEMYEGAYIRTKKTVTDYAWDGGKVDNIGIGLFDPNSKSRSTCCDRKPGEIEEEQERERIG